MLELLTLFARTIFSEYNIVSTLIVKLLRRCVAKHRRFESFSEHLLKTIFIYE